jgi:hypothetical protein
MVADGTQVLSTWLAIGGTSGGVQWYNVALRGTQLVWCCCWCRLAHLAPECRHEHWWWPWFSLGAMQVNSGRTAGGVPQHQGTGEGRGCTIRVE